MDNNSHDVNNVAMESSTADSDTGSTQAVPVENRIAELNRRFGKLERTLEDKMSQILSLAQSSQTMPAEKAAASYMTEDSGNDAEFMTKTEYYKQRDSEILDQFKLSYPEIDKASDKYDPDFFQTADEYYREFSVSKNPKIRTSAIQKALEQAAIDTGRFQQVERHRIMTDEAKRSRLLGEGTMASKGAMTDKSSVPDNVKTLAKMFGIDDKRLKEYYKK